MDIRSIAANLRACGIVSARQMEQITTELLCNRPDLPSCGCGGGGGSTVQDMQVSWTPTSEPFPKQVGFISYDSINPSLVETLTFKQDAIDCGIDLENFQALTSITFLATAMNILTQGLFIVSCPVLSSVSFPNVVSGSGAWSITGNALLTTLVVTGFLPTNTFNYDFTGNALSVSTVNAVLARFVANPGYVFGNLKLQNQTPAAPPSGQGIIDKATLSGRGVTVTTD